MGILTGRILQRSWLLIWILVLIGAAQPPGVTVQAQPGPAQECYMVADSGDALWHIDIATATTTRIGPLGSGFNRVEAIAMNLSGTVLYGAQDDMANGIFGTINMTTGAMTAIGPIGPGNGINPATGLPTTAALADVDSLSIHPWTGEMWGITQDESANKIFRINLNTGAIVPNTFGPGLDYAQLIVPPPLSDIDDLGIDPLTGRFYVIANSSGTNDRLYEVDINGFDPPSSPTLNPASGTIEMHEIGPLVYAGPPPTDIFDMEGFAFFNDGTFFGTTGDQGGALSDHVWQIDPATGTSLSVTPGEIDDDGAAPYNSDFESIGCLTAGSNRKSGIVFEDLNGNGVFDGTDIVYAGATVRFYRDNGNGSFDGGDQLIQTAVTNASGAYSFEVAVPGTFFVVLDLATLPPGTTLTTVGSYTVNFVGYDNTLTNNNFGFWELTQPPPPVDTDTPTPSDTPIPSDTPTPSDTPALSETPRSPDDPNPAPGTTPDPGRTPDPPLTPGSPSIFKQASVQSTLPGETVTFTITVTNSGTMPLTGVVVTDMFDGTFFSAVLEVSTTKGTAGIVDDLLVTVYIGDLAPGETVTITILARVRTDISAPDSTLNVAIMSSNEHDPISSSVPVGLLTLPSTGYPPDSPANPLPGLLAGVLGIGAVGALLVWRRRR